jgi:hypothetical protein
MDKVSILCDKDSRILHDFCTRCMDVRKGRSFLALPLPFVRTYMNANVEKEIEKDRMVIEYAASRFAEGKSCCDHEIGELFEMTKQVDKAFLRKVTVPSLSIAIRYEDIAGIRKARIDCVSRCVHDLLAHWENGRPVEDAVRSAYRMKEFRELIKEVLHLYSQETRQLSNSIRLFGPLQLAVDAFAVSLYRTMEQVAEDLAAFYTGRVYGKEAAA